MNEAGSLPAPSVISTGVADANEKDAVVAGGLDCSGVKRGVLDAKLNPGTGLAAGNLLASEVSSKAFDGAGFASIEGDGLPALGEPAGFLPANAEKPPIAGFAAAGLVFSSSLVPVDSLNDPLATGLVATTGFAFASDALVKGVVVGVALVFLLALSPVLLLTGFDFRVAEAGVDSAESTGGAPRFARGVYRNGSRFTEDGRPVRGIRPLGVPERLTLR